MTYVPSVLVGASLSDPHINGVSSRNYGVYTIYGTMYVDYVTLIVSATYVILIVNVTACSYFSVVI